jgi:Zn-dependent protease
LVDMTGKLSVWFALLNLLPVPSLTGSHLLMIALPQSGHWIAKLQPFVAVLLAVLAATGWVTWLLAPAYRVLAGPILGE